MHGWYGFLTSVPAALLVVALLGCGGNGGTTQEVLDEWEGEYIYYVLYEEWQEFEVRWAEFVADGSGTVEVDQEGTFDYTIDADRNVVVTPDPEYERMFGRISADGGVVVLGDPVYDIPGNNDKDVELAIVVRKSSGHTRASLAGTYHLCQAGAYEQGFFTSRVELVVSADGTATWELLADSRGRAGNGNTFFTVDSSDGSITVSGGLFEAEGMVSPDGNLFVIADGDPKDPDGEVVLGVGVRHDAGAGTPDGRGMWTLCQLAQSDSMTAFRCYGSRMQLDIGDDDFTYVIEAHSEGHTGTGGPEPYTVAGDGWLSFPGRTMQGHISPDGGFMALASTDMKVEDEILIALALK